MSLQNTQRLVQYVGNNATWNFAIPFVFYSDSHIKIWKEVISTGAVTLFVLGSNYSLSGSGSPVGGSVTLFSMLTLDERITIARVVPYEQLTDYVNNARLDADAHERQMDSIVMQVQQLADTSNLYGSQVLKFPITEPISSNSTLPSKLNRRGKILSFDSETGDLLLLTIDELYLLLVPPEGLPDLLEKALTLGGEELTLSGAILTLT